MSRPYPRTQKCLFLSEKGTRQIKTSCCPAGFPLCPVQFERKWPLFLRSGSLQTRVTIKNQLQRVEGRKFAYRSPKHIRRDKQALRTLRRKTALKCSTYSFFLSNFFPFLPLSSSSVAFFPTGTPFPRAARMNSIPLFRHTAQLLKQTAHWFSLLFGLYTNNLDIIAHIYQMTKIKRQIHFMLVWELRMGGV